YADPKAIREAGRTAHASDASGNDLRRSTAASSWLPFSVLVCEDRTVRNDRQHGRIVPQGGEGVLIRHFDGRGIDAAEVHAERRAGPAHDRRPGCGTGAFTKPHDVVVGALGEGDASGPLQYHESRDKETRQRAGTGDDGTQAFDSHSVSSPEVDQKSSRPRRLLVPSDRE